MATGLVATRSRVENRLKNVSQQMDRASGYILGTECKIQVNITQCAKTRNSPSSKIFREINSLVTCSL